MLSRVLNNALLLMLHVVHIAIIVFCLIGWLISPLRHWHLALCALILASWFGLGFWKGWGYCLVTDIQWRLLRHNGNRTPSYGYMPMLLRRLTGQEIDAQFVDQVTEWVFYAITLASLLVNWSWLRTLL